MATEIWLAHYLAFIPTNKKWWQIWLPKYITKWLPYTEWPKYVHPSIKDKLSKEE